MNPESATPGPEPVQPVVWPHWLRFLFRVAFVYFVLYIFPFPLGSLPLQLVSEKAAAAVSTHVLEPYSKGMDSIVKWVGTKWFDVTITIGPNGSGDTTWNFVQLALFAAAAVAVAPLWTLVDRWRRNYARLHDWLRAYVRYYLAATMLGYGAVKVIKLQFSTPGIDALVRPLGAASPMGLLWNFMGFSDAYCFFAGACEVVGGVLLISRRTTPLGALFSAAVMTNVVMLNFCFDTPVKLFSSNLLAMALFLALPEARRLIDVFLLHRPPKFDPLRPLFRSRILHVAALLFRTALIGSIAWVTFKGSWDGRNQSRDNAARPPLYGTWDVEVFEVDGELLPEDASGPGRSPHDRWQRLRIGLYRMSLERSDGSTQLLFAQSAPKGDRLALSRESDATWHASFKCEQTTPDALTLDGNFDGRELHVELARNPSADFLLTGRGFHWINEFPFNR